MRSTISIVYVYYNTPFEILSSIKSVPNAIGNLAYEIIVIDNNSSKPLPSEINKIPNIKIIKSSKNYGYGKGLNQGVKISNGNYLLLTNPDTEFLKDSIVNLLRRIKQDSKIGIIAPQVIDEKGKILQSISGMPYLPKSLFVFSLVGKIFPNNSFIKSYHNLDLDRNIEQEVDVVGGACMMIRKSVFNSTYGFDENFFMYFEEADFCYRVRKLRYKVVYYPKAKVIHFVGKSTQDKEWIEKTFEQSRFKFYKKYHGLLSAIMAEVFLRLSKTYSLAILCILAISLFLNLYKINTLMLFIGDMGRDYLAARDMLLTKSIPLVGITSSVTWLHQGPISIYLIGFSFLLSNFNPVAPAILYGVIGVITTFLVYKLGSLYFNRNIGILASIFYATSPLTVLNARMPYHSSLIPFFASIFFIVLYKFLSGNRKLLPFLFFSLGLLLQTELSNAVLILFIAVLIIFKKSIFKLKYIIGSIIGFIIGISPFVIYDFTHKFVQTIGFPLWIINRIRLFFGLTMFGNSTTAHTPEAIMRVLQQISSFIFPSSIVIICIVIFIITWSVYRERKRLYSINSLSILLLALVIPVFGFIIHTTPGTAYFPLLFPFLSILVAFSFYNFQKKIKLSIVLFLILIIFNMWSLIKNDYFLNTISGYHSLPPFNYSFGPAWVFQDDVAKFIVNDARGRIFRIEGGGFLSTLQTGIDNYKYLVFWRKGKLDEQSKLEYAIYQNIKEINKSERITYKNKYLFVVKK